MTDRNRAIRIQGAVFLALGIASISLSRPSNAQQVIRGPYLQTGTHSSVVIKWRTDDSTGSRVDYGLAIGRLSSSESASGLATDHEVTLTNLQPETKYYYSVGTTSAVLAGNDSSHFFVTSPLPGSKKPSRIWILGDSGTHNRNARAVRDAYYDYTGARHTDLWMMLGDNAYEDGDDNDYQEAVFEMYPEMLRKSVLWPTRGNHDRAPKDGSGNWTGAAYYDIFTLPTGGEAGGMASGTEAYYSFDYANVHFICLESTSSDLREPGSAMWTWLEEDLAANTQDWTIAFWHHPPYSKGSHNSDREDRLEEMRERALPILEDWGVDLVLSGHSHSYERSFLLDRHYGRSSTLADSMKIDAGDGRIGGDGAYEKSTIGSAPHEGAVYVVAGSSGKVSGGNLDHPVMIEAMKVLGSVVLDLDDDQMGAKFIDDQGAVRDYFTIFKGSRDTTVVVEPGQHDYGPVALGDSVSKSFLLTNPAAVAIDVKSAAMVGVAADEFTLKSSLNLLTVSPGDSIVLRVDFAPAVEGDRVAQLVLNINDPGQESLVVELSGVGFLPVSEVTVSPVLSTGQTPSDTDDPAIWIHPTDPSKSVIVGTDKKAGLFVWDLEGNELQRIALGTNVNNVDLRQDVALSGQSVDVVAANLRDAGKLAVFQVNPNYSGGNVLIQLAGVQSSNNDLQKESYGFCLYKRPSDDALFVFDKPKSGGKVRQYAITDNGGQGVAVTPVRDLDYSGGTAEGFVADDELGFVYITEEDRGIHKYFADPQSGGDPIALFATGNGTESDREGLALYACDDSTGYFVLSSQGNSTLKIYERQGSNRFLKTVIPLDDEGKDGLGTDGLDVTSFAPPGFPNGLLVVHDQSAKRFHVYDWADIAESDLSICPRQRTVPAPAIELDAASFDYGEVPVDSTSRKTLVIANRGVAELSVTGLTLAGVDSNQFTFDGNPTSFAIASEDSAKLFVGFKPNSAGSKQAVLRFESNDPNNSSLEVSLAGQGVEDVTVSVEGGSGGALPTEIILKSTYPNPFNAGTTVEYSLPKAGEVRVRIFNLIGQPLRDLVHAIQEPGLKKIRWNGRDDHGNEVSSGIYYVRLQVGEQELIKRITLLK